MKLEDIDFDDEDLETLSDPEEQETDEDVEKPWLTNEEESLESEMEEEDDESDDEPEDDLITSLLKDKGIDPSSVKIANDRGEIEEKDFNDLTKEEQLLILNYNDSDDDYGLEDSEVQIINFLRENNMNINDYNNMIAQRAIQNYINNNNQQQTFEIDDLSDEDLFILDLKAKISDLTEEEALAELENAQANEALFTRRMDSLRQEYRDKESAIVQQEAEEKQAAQQQQAAQYEKVIVDAITKNDSIDLGDSSITFSEDDMNEIASFILDSDAAGVRHIAKALNDPQTLIGMAWYALHGQETFGLVADYYKGKIAEASRYNYQKGYEDARNGRKPNSTKTTTVKKPSSKPTQQRSNVKSIHDLDF